MRSKTAFQFLQHDALSSPASAPLHERLEVKLTRLHNWSYTGGHDAPPDRPSPDPEAARVKLVLDTNVVIDWLVFDDPYMSPLREGVRNKRVEVVTHQPAVDELKRVLGYAALKLDLPRQQWVLERYVAQTSLVLASGARSEALELPGSFPSCRDPDDNHFLALTFHAKADALISRDLAVLKLKRRAAKFGFQILNVQQMIAALSSAAGHSSSAGHGLVP